MGTVGEIDIKDLKAQTDGRAGTQTRVAPLHYGLWSKLVHFIGNRVNISRILSSQLSKLYTPLTCSVFSLTELRSSN